MAENKKKDSNQICDNIFEREAHKFEELYELYLAEKAEDEKRNELSKFDLDRQKQRLDEMVSRVETTWRINQEFEHGSYFNYIKLKDLSNLIDRKKIHKAKLDGQYNVKIAKHMPTNERITAFANDDMVYYMHKRGHFFTKLRGTLTHAQLEDRKIKR